MSFEKPKNLAQTLDGVNRDLEEKEALQFALKKSLPYVDLSKIAINPDTLRVIPEEEAEKARVIPFFKIGNKARIGAVDPESQACLALIQELATQGISIQMNIISESSFWDGKKQYLNVREMPVEIVENVIQRNIIKRDVQPLILDVSKKPYEIVNDIFVAALEYNASDIHIEPKDAHAVIRYRVDGILTQVADIDVKTAHDITSQVKHQSNLKLNVTTRPQDGRTFFLVNGEKMDIRVSTLPVSTGEDVVMRILGGANQGVKLVDLGMEEHHLQLVQKMLTHPQGLTLVTGPTGSGKTTTLYTLINELNTGRSKIITLEDPIEYRVDGISQSQIRETENYTFASGLRSILRQDPDIILVGEIRDKETAEVCIQAALTGHKVFSTIHTNSALGAITRLVNMGIPAYILAPALDMVISQRLIRKVVPNEMDTFTPNDALGSEISSTLKTLSQVTHQEYQIPKSFYKSFENKNQSHFGYKGRLGIFEILSCTADIQNLIIQGASESQLFDTAKQHGMLTLFQSGILKVLQEQSSLEEVYRVTRNFEVEDAI